MNGKRPGEKTYLVTLNCNEMEQVGNQKDKIGKRMFGGAASLALACSLRVHAQMADDIRAGMLLLAGERKASAPRCGHPATTTSMVKLSTTRVAFKAQHVVLQHVNLTYAA